MHGKQQKGERRRASCWGGSREEETETGEKRTPAGMSGRYGKNVFQLAREQESLTELRVSFRKHGGK